jgi:hypothetical protein
MRTGKVDELVICFRCEPGTAATNSSVLRSAIDPLEKPEDLGHETVDVLGLDQGLLEV